MIDHDVYEYLMDSERMYSPPMNASRIWSPDEQAENR